MSKTSIKAEIDANIRTNGTQAITGSVLNSVLKDMVTDGASQEEVTTLSSEVDIIEGDLYNTIEVTDELTNKNGLFATDDGVIKSTSDNYRLSYFKAYKNIKYFINADSVFVAEGWCAIALYSQIPESGLSPLAIIKNSSDYGASVNAEYTPNVDGYIGMYYEDMDNTPYTAFHTENGSSKLDDLNDSIDLFRKDIYKKKNVVQTSMLIEGVFATADGQIKSTSTDYQADYIKVLKGEKYTIKNNSLYTIDGWCQIALYSSLAVGTNPVTILKNGTGNSDSIELDYVADEELYMVVYRSSGCTNRTSFYKEVYTTETLFDESQMLTLPSKLFAVVGYEFNVYWDTLVMTPPYGDSKPNIFMQAVCEKGKNTTRCYRFTPSVSDVGEYDITFEYYSQKGDLLGSKTSKLIVLNPSSISVPQTNILHIGDSTIDDEGYMIDFLYNTNMAECGITTLLPIGTRGYVGARHEAHTGFKYESYVLGNVETEAKVYISNLSEIMSDINIKKIYPHPQYLSPSGYTIFIDEINVEEGWVTIGNNILENGWSGTLITANERITSVNAIVTNVVNNASMYKPFLDENGNISFSSYMSNKYKDTSKTIDLLIMACGINDVRLAKKSEEQFSLMLQYVKDLTDAFLEYNPNGKVLISIPKIMVSVLTSIYPSTFTYNSFTLRRKLIETFDNNAYSQNVFVFGEGNGMDRFWGYWQDQTNNLASRIPIKSWETDNDVHPCHYGYQQIADTYLGALLYYCKAN